MNCMRAQASRARKGLQWELGAHLGHSQASPKSPKLITASAKPDSRGAFKVNTTRYLNCSFI